MQGSGLRSAALFAALSALAMGCNDLGTCDDPLNGRTPVKAGSTVMYAGQAIITSSCASGCHSSGAKGASRSGAPEGLDFDLLPKPGGAVVEGPDGGVRAVELNNIDVAGLRARQRIVFDQRELIWEQVDQGLMPPGLSIQAALSGLSKFMFGSAGECPAATDAGQFEDPKGELRKWLACGVPIIETNSTSLPFVPVSQASDAGAPEKALGAIAYAGAVGYQVTACSFGGGEGGTGPTFGQVYSTVFQGAYGCTGCHANGQTMGNFDISTEAGTYMRLLGANMQGGMTSCPPADNPRPFVVPNNPAGSYLIAKLGGSGSGTACGDLMPFDMGVSENDLELVRQWIMGGALP
jgi:hypothetical protein